MGITGPQVEAARDGRQRPASTAVGAGDAGGKVSMRDLAGKSRSLLAANLAYLALTWALVAGAVALFGFYPNPLTFVLAFVVVSARQQALLNIEHDCIHGIFTKRRRLDDAVAVLFAASPAGSPYHASRARHLAHHRLLATPEDPDLPLHTTSDKDTSWKLVRYFGLGLTGAYAATVFLKGPPSGLSREDRLRDLRNLALAQLVLWAIFWLTIGWWSYLALWVAPLVTLTPACHLVRSFVEHAVLPGERPEHDNLLVSIKSNPVERFLVAPFNMNYHAEHHLYPYVPAFRLPKVQARLAETAEPPRLRRSSYARLLARYGRSLSARTSG